MEQSLGSYSLVIWSTGGQVHGLWVSITHQFKNDTKAVTLHKTWQWANIDQNNI